MIISPRAVGFERSCASAATPPSWSTSPSCCSAAAASSAAPSNCEADPDEHRRRRPRRPSHREEGAHLAHNYHPLPVVVSRAEGVWVTDVEGKRYLDLLSAYSALNFGHGHRRSSRPRASSSTLDAHQPRVPQRPSRALRHGARAALRQRHVLPMNTGAEAVETGIKVARAWGYRTKGIAPDAATIIVANGNFHGRTTTIVGFSDDPTAHDDFGPYAPGFVHVPYGDADAIAAAIDENTAAVLLEPIQARPASSSRPRGSCSACARSARRTTCCSSPTRSSRASDAWARPSRATARASCPTCTCSARRWAAASSRLGRRRGRRRARRHPRR